MESRKFTIFYLFLEYRLDSAAILYCVCMNATTNNNGDTTMTNKQDTRTYFNVDGQSVPSGSKYDGRAFSLRVFHDTPEAALADVAGQLDGRDLLNVRLEKVEFCDGSRYLITRRYKLDSQGVVPAR